MMSAPEGGFKIMVGESTLPANPDKGRADKRKINMQTAQERVAQQ